jgi:hypothetical protein
MLGQRLLYSRSFLAVLSVVSFSTLIFLLEAAFVLSIASFFLFFEALTLAGASGSRLSLILDAGHLKHTIEAGGENLS